MTVWLEMNRKASTRVPASDADCQTRVECLMERKAEPPYLFPNADGAPQVEDRGDNLSPRREWDPGSVIFRCPDIKRWRMRHNPRNQPIFREHGQREAQRVMSQSDLVFRKNSENL
jgi:hypothetical protein